MAAAVPKMSYRFLGPTGLLVSKLSLGAFMVADSRHTDDAWYAVMKYAFERGVNFFDGAEMYMGGESERIVGRAVQRGIAEGIWTREDLVLTTKIFFGTKSGPNNQGNSRKHLIEGAKASLKRMQVDYVDVIYCHRFDALTPIEETVRAMNYLIDNGLAFYWGTSQWLARDIVEACEIADRLGMIRPVVEQPKYNIFDRPRVEGDFQILFDKYKLGLTTYSPLSYGVLSGKYTTDVTPDGSRFATEFYHQILPDFAERVVKTYPLKEIANELGISLAQLSIAWCASNENVSTVMLGARTVEQLRENLDALAFVEKITPEIRTRIDATIQYVREPAVPERQVHLRAAYL
jgi:voltage-dependent potassium channel beta subunit